MIVIVQAKCCHFDIPTSVVQLKLTRNANFMCKPCVATSLKAELPHPISTFWYMHFQFSNRNISYQTQSIVLQFYFGYENNLGLAHLGSISLTCLCTAFTTADPKSAKSCLIWLFFALSGSTLVIARKMLVKLTLDKKMHVFSACVNLDVTISIKILSFLRRLLQNSEMFGGEKVLKR